MDYNDNQRWIDALRGDGMEREEALGCLRDILLRGLRSSFASRTDLSSLEDVAQEALIKITSKLDTFRGTSRFATWAMSIAVRTAISEARRARWRDVSLDEMVEAGRIAPVGENNGRAGEEKIAYERLVGVIRTALTSLTERQRQTIEAELAGAPPDEIAHRMGSNRNAVYKLGYDARARLKKIILESGWTEEQVRQLVGSL